MILSAVIMVIFGIKYSISKVSAWIILFALVTMLVKYMINCFYTNINYRKKNGLLSFGTLNSTLDFVAVAIFIVTMILSKLSKWIGVFKYADCVGTILISGYMVYKGVSIIINSVKAKSEDKTNEIIEKCKNEITVRKEIKKVEQISKQEKEHLLDIAKRTWNYFETYMNEQNNFLPPDNYQEKRKNEVTKLTSSTNIGLGLLAIMSASDLGFIDNKKKKEMINNSLDTIENLEKWNGHLYNWYNIKNLEVVVPKFVSTVDSGNFVGYLYVLKQFLIITLKSNGVLKILINQF